MKKLLFIICFILLSGSFAHANFDNNISVWHEWRSTQTCASVSNILVATGPVFLAEVVVTSASATSLFVFSNSSTTADIAKTTSTFYDATTSGTVYRTATTLSNGFVFTKTGSACVRFNWDWHAIQRGRESEGKHRP